MTGSAGDAVCADAKFLLRAVVGDHPAQTAEARRVLGGASLVAVTVVGLCEFVWVLRRGYRFETVAIAAAIRALLQAPNVWTDRDAVAAGLRHIEAGGDFADGVIAHAGRATGAGRLVTFDRRAVAILQAEGVAATVLAGA